MKYVISAVVAANACLALPLLALTPPTLPVAGAAAGANLPRLSTPLAKLTPGIGGVASLTIDPFALAEAASVEGAFRIDAFPLEPGRVATLEVERFEIMRPGGTIARGVRGRDEVIDFDPSAMVFLRGHIAGECHSSVFLSISPWATLGYIDQGAGGTQYWISSRPNLGDAPAAPALITAGAGSAPSAMCLASNVVPPSAPAPEAEPKRGLRQIQIAVDTDHEFYQLFNDEPATVAYLLTVYAANSVVFMRDINCYLDLTYLRVWPTPTEPFEADLNAFRDYWQANMGFVVRDTAQMFSGRGDKAGGVAWLPGLCNSSAYSFCGNGVGFWEDPADSNVWIYDLHVTTHEFGHNFGTPHTDTLGIDKCNLYNEPPRRGTIMSYCNQTISGGEAIIDLRFHKLAQEAMLDTIPGKACVVFDCNMNGVDDAIDLAMGTSPDANANAIPDECEDCNGNGTIDSTDIGSGASFDMNANGIPDECEPDCNGNLVPDDMDIGTGTSQDLHGDGVPDECDLDCDGQDGSDYNQIMADMALDKNRNRFIDDCEDCDGDGTPDLEELGGAFGAWVGSSNASSLRRFTPVVGVLDAISDAGPDALVQDVVITADRRVLASFGGTDSIVEFDSDGNLVGTLVSGLAGLDFPTGMLVVGDELLVASRNTNAVLRFDAATGAFLGELIPSAGSVLVQPHGLAIGTDGDLFVSNSNNRIQRYDMPSGAFVGTFVNATGSLNNPKGILFLPDGNLLVCSYNSSRLKRYHGTTGAYLGNWQITSIDFNGPWCLRLGPDGHVYVSQNVTGETHFTKPRISVFNVNTGNWMRALVNGNDTGLFAPTGFAFLPGKGFDCNMNRRPDNCDIAMGFSTDHNANGIPDECETCYPDCEGDDDLDVFDFLCFQGAYAQQSPYADCEGDGDWDVFDFLCFQGLYASGCGF